jgi:hypothetical protein
MGQLVKLTITPCEIEDGVVAMDNTKKFTVMLNPDEYSHTHAISYDQKKAFGDVGTVVRFNAVGNETVTFTIFLDGTGVVSSTAPDVKTQIQQLNSIVYSYNGNDHEPNHVRLLWGTFIFFGRLTSMSSDFTMFKPSGAPLRAKVKLTFSGFMSKEEQALTANRSSPDLTHVVEIRAGDTLPLLCHRIYKDPSYYTDVARANNLVNFRDLKPGLRVHFPPLE